MMTQDKPVMPKVLITIGILEAPRSCKAAASVMMREILANSDG